jgi:GNAT superfamily N-acetyltransferase
MTAGTFTPIITPFQRRHLQLVRDLLFYSAQMHAHLDWQESDDWLETSAGVTRLAWYHGHLIGLMSCSRPLHNSVWLRLAAVADQQQRTAILQALWQDMLPELRTTGVKLVGLLALNDWILADLPALGFHYQEDIVTLRRAGQRIPELTPTAVRVRVAQPDELATLTEIDQKAFDPPWQMDYEEMRQAYRNAYSCTVAEWNGMLLGFQISTFFLEGAHLARLAVTPQAQGKGIGALILHDLLQRFIRRGVYAMTVNTQSSNSRSRRLYERFNFQANGYDLPYWTASI